jgi:hypothetical protein
MRPLIARLVALFRRRQGDDELADEMSAHLELSTADYVDRGMSLADARRAAALRFGGTLQTAEAYRDRRGFALLESLWQDMRYALRTLRRTPLFAVTVAATMGLGLGLAGSAFTDSQCLPAQAHRPTQPACVVRAELGHRYNAPPPVRPGGL